jgi:Ca-activated chloride channel family protein
MSQPVRMLEIPKERLCGVGILSTEREGKRVLFPLAGVKISAQVADRVATVTMLETFQNPYPEHLETVYIFPLPGGAAVSDFEMRVGERIVKGKVEERAEARRQYQEAIDQGKRAAIMEKERDSVFTVQVGNIPPNEEIMVQITYSERLSFFDDGTTEIRLPLVVAPRYIPGQALERGFVGDGIETDTNLVPDASRISPPRLAQGFDPKVALSIDVKLILDEDSSGEISNLCCSQHATQTFLSREGIRVSLAYENELLNRDFVLKWSLSGKKLRPSLLFHKTTEGKTYGMLSLIPPYNEGQNKQARDVVFVLDHSGSMEGIKMSSATRACALLINTLGVDDRFAIQIFDNSTSWFDSLHHKKDGRFIPADAYGIEQGETYLRKVKAEGGTEIQQALNQAINALAIRQNKTNRVPVVVLLTDGEIGNETQVLKDMQKKLGNTRLFTVGIDTAVNEGFLKRLADIGKGTATFVAPGANLEQALINVGREIGLPLIVNISIEDVDSGLILESIAPCKVVDLFSGRATTTFFAAQCIGKIRVKGYYPNGDKFETVVNGKEISLPAISQLWAKTRINDLEDSYRINAHLQTTIKSEIIALSIEHKILTKFTAFIAVDQEIVNKEGVHRKVVQPVESPAGWDTKAASAMPSISQPSKAKTIQIPQPPPATYTKESTPYVAKRSPSPISQSANLTSCGVISVDGANLDKKAEALNNYISNAPQALYDICESFSDDFYEDHCDDERDCDEEYEDEECNEELSESGEETLMEPNIAVSCIPEPEFERAPMPKKVASTVGGKPVALASDTVAVELAFRAFIDSYIALDKQGNLSVRALSNAIQEMIGLIYKFALSKELPKTFNFFNNLAPTLIGSSNKTIGKQIFAKHQGDFEEAIKEMDSYLGTKIFEAYKADFLDKAQSLVNTKGKKGSFWDSSI